MPFEVCLPMNFQSVVRPDVTKYTYSSKGTLLVEGRVLIAELDIGKRVPLDCQQGLRFQGVSTCKM